VYNVLMVDEVSKAKPCDDKLGRDISWCIGASKPKWELGKKFVCPYCGKKYTGIAEMKNGNHLWRVED